MIAIGSKHLNRCRDSRCAGCPIEGWVASREETMVGRGNRCGAENGERVPISDPSARSKSARTVWLLNQLVRADEHRRWDGDPERLRGLHVDGEFEMCRLLYRQIRGLGTFENLVDIDSSTP